jgi:hypothetical protein
MLLEHDSIFTKLQADLHPSWFSRLFVFNWACYSKQAILEALALVGNAITAHTRRLVMHGESVHHDLHCLESIALEISSLFAAEGAAVKRKREEINSKVFVTDLQGPPSERTQSDKMRDLKSLAQYIARDRGSCDDTRISYLEFVESEAEADLTLARMIAG